MDDYKKKILELFLKKQHKRQANNIKLKVNRRISVSPSDVYKKYDSNDANVEKIEAINKDVKELENLEFIVVDYIPYSSSVKKMYMVDNALEKIENYMFDKYKITSRMYLIDDLSKLYYKYISKGEITKYYSEKQLSILKSLVNLPDFFKEEEILKALAFIQDNDKDIFLREASMLIYGSSKKLESSGNIIDVICNIVREYLKIPQTEYEKNDEILKQYHISNIYQEILIKGNITIILDGYKLQVKYFKNGISLQSSDIERIEKIIINTKSFMTIENKTSFYRYEKNDCSFMYLGGYANRQQIVFLKKIYVNNNKCKYYHFGDIDIGGFLIHQHLCASTEISFHMYLMGIEELKNSDYKKCIQNLSDNDRKRAVSLSKIDTYKDRIEYMLSNNCKLEQEIISYK